MRKVPQVPPVRLAQLVRWALPDRKELQALQDRQALKELLDPKELRAAKDQPAQRGRKVPLAQ